MDRQIKPRDRAINRITALDAQRNQLLEQVSQLDDEISEPDTSEAFLSAQAQMIDLILDPRNDSSSAAFVAELFKKRNIPTQWQDQITAYASWLNASLSFDDAAVMRSGVGHRFGSLNV